MSHSNEIKRLGNFFRATPEQIEAYTDELRGYPLAELSEAVQDCIDVLDRFPSVRQIKSMIHSNKHSVTGAAVELTEKTLWFIEDKKFRENKKQLEDLVGVDGVQKYLSYFIDRTFREYPTAMEYLDRKKIDGGWVIKSAILFLVQGGMKKERAIVLANQEKPKPNLSQKVLYGKIKDVLVWYGAGDGHNLAAMYTLFEKNTPDQLEKVCEVIKKRLTGTYSVDKAAVRRKPTGKTFEMAKVALEKYNWDLKSTLAATGELDH